MKPSFLILAGTNALLMVITFVVGLTVTGTPEDGGAYLNAYGRHFVLGLMTMLFTCLLHVITFTYFVVFSRMARDAVATAGMDESNLLRIAALRGACARWLLLGVGSILLTGIFGALAAGGWALDPMWHLVIAAGALAANGASWVGEYALIGRNVAMTELLYAALPGDSATRTSGAAEAGRAAR
jgi:hypothetical protein